ncbi:MAG: A/G-specific adenine glycosylase [Dehalococcoidia bacterium]|nr:A/G-specific adenine glycosylase [Dehalococcoidia bacterium]
MRVHRLLLEWFATHKRDMPWRRTRDPFAILVSEFMLQQTQVARVTPKYEVFMTRFPTIEALAAASVSEVLKAWSGLGYNMRSIRLHRVAQEVVKSFGGTIPSAPDDLRKLPGIGAYSAAAVACFAFAAQMPTIDVNVRRVVGRVLFGIESPSVKEMDQAATDLLPTGKARDWNLALMDLGATVCTAKRPHCFECPLRDGCVAAPEFESPLRQVAESTVTYKAKQPFRESNRYYRGRIVEALRHVPDDGVPLARLGPTVKDGFKNRDLPWLKKLVDGLAKDGLVFVIESGNDPASEGDITVSLPGG